MADPPRFIAVRLVSDATFGVGFDPTGPADVDVAHDARTGTPIIPGSTLRALLRFSWRSMAPAFGGCDQAARRVFGPSGDVVETAILHVGDARAPLALRQLIEARVGQDKLSPEQVLAAYTAVRAQTAIEAETGTAAPRSLRLVRVVRSGLVLEAPLDWLAAPSGLEVGLLAAAVLGVRHAGLSRSRGRGAVELSLDGHRAATVGYLGALEREGVGPSSGVGPCSGTEPGPAGRP